MMRPAEIPLNVAVAHYEGELFKALVSEFGSDYARLADVFEKENGLHVLDFAWPLGGFHPSEVENLTETKIDLLARWKEKNQ